MLNRNYRLLLQCLALTLCLFALRANAEPYLAVQMGLKCGQCHVNPTGGGLRTQFGDVFAQTQLPQDKIDTGPELWTGDISKFLRIGGDLRFDGSVMAEPKTKTENTFTLQQTRVYLEASVIPDRFLVYVDEQVAPGGATNHEAYGVFWSANHDWYVKAGQMYLPFGLRLQDQEAFIITQSGISMFQWDQGVEFGWEHGHWDAQFDVTDGTGGASSTDNGKQYTGQLQWVETQFRVGGAANINYKTVGNKSEFALFGGVRTGPVEWLGQMEVIDDKSVVAGPTPFVGQRQLASLAEADWLIAKGNNLKVTAEFLDPNRNTQNGSNEGRLSLVYEWTPIQFAQIRGGVRYGDGIPEISSMHTKLYFVELHGFL
jgi:hypothetical protein